MTHSAPLFPQPPHRTTTGSAFSGEERRLMLDGARLYLCTDARGAQGDLEAFLHAAYAGGVDIIQLRDKQLDTDEEMAALQLLAGVAREHGRMFAVNDRADVAALVGADVFHIGQRDLSPQQARALLGPEVVIGRSTHTPEQAATARQDSDVDYYCTGPVWETPTKPGRAATGTGFLSSTAQAAGAGQAMAAGQAAEAGPAAGADLGARSGSGARTVKPWFAIGGIDEERLPQVLSAGAERIVVVRAITQAADPAAAAARLRAQLAG